jgi:transposase
MPKRPKPDPKIQSLRQDGALNPRPQRVTDELFRGSAFFDPRDLVQVKYEMLRCVQQDGQAITAAAAKFGFSRPIFYQAQATFQAGGLAGLIPHKRGPKEGHKLTPEVLEFVQQALQQEPSLGSAELATRIQKRFDLTVHRRTIERGLARHKKKRRTQG